MKINHGDYLQLMDRLHIQTYMVEQHLVSHPLIKKNKKVKKLINDASWALLEAHQIVSEESQKLYETETSIHKVVFRRCKKS